MNAPATLTDVPTLNRAFIHEGLARFGREHLAAPSGVFERLGNDGALFALLGTPRDDWLAACTALARRAPDLPGAWGGILHDYQLQLHEWFAFALAGEAESSHLVNLALAELQTPGVSPRPGLHLLEAMSQGLFAAPLPPLAWANHPLVRHHLAEMEGDLPLPLASLRVPARLWALCSGDGRLWPDFQPIAPRPGQALPASLESRIVLAADLLRRGDLRVIVIRGTRPAGFAVASRLAAALGLAPVETSADTWSSHPLLATACRYAGWLPVLALELGPGDRFAPGPEAPRQTPMVLIAGQDGTVEASDVLELTIPPLDRAERLAAWRQALGPDAPPPLADHALIDGPSIHVLAGRMRHAAAHRDEAPGLQHLRAARADHGAERLRILAQPVSRQIGPDGLVLPAETARQFEQLLCRCTMRERLWSGLGASLTAPTPGVRALFAGESGAGKTLAASRLATELGAPLYRVDLAAVMNKYVGETEKNLGRLLDEAAALDAILLMDEADALFGRRSEGKETGERYANMMTNFLLTRIESHPGIVILTTNARNRLDSAFTRRFDAIIEFPLPGVEERYRLWQSHLGGRSPGETMCRLLASYSDLPGGHIRNAVIHAVALSLRPADQPVEPALLVAALAEEYRKLGRTPPPQLDQLGLNPPGD